MTGLRDSIASAWAETWARDYGDAASAWGVVSALTQTAQGQTWWADQADIESKAAAMQAAAKLPAGSSPLGGLAAGLMGVSTGVATARAQKAAADAKAQADFIKTLQAKAALARASGDSPQDKMMLAIASELNSRAAAENRNRIEQGNLTVRTQEAAASQQQKQAETA